MDNIARSMLDSGELRRLAWNDRVAGVTSNPTIFEKAMGHGPEYEAPARALAEQGKTAEEIYWALAIEDIQGAADVLRATYDLTDGARRVRQPGVRAVGRQRHRRRRSTWRSTCGRASIGRT